MVATLDRLDRAVDALVEVSFEALTTPERLRVLERLEVVARRLPVAQYALLNQLDEQAGEAELGGRLAAVVASRLRITRSEAGRRVAEAADVGPRRALSGQPVGPVLTATAAALRQDRKSVV